MDDLILFVGFVTVLAGIFAFIGWIAERINK